MLVYGKLVIHEKFDTLWKNTFKLRRGVRETEAENILDELFSRIGCIYLMI